MVSGADQNILPLHSWKGLMNVCSSCKTMNIFGDWVDLTVSGMEWVYIPGVTAKKAGSRFCSPEVDFPAITLLSLMDSH